MTKRRQPGEKHDQRPRRKRQQQRQRPWEAATTAGMDVELTANGLWIDIHDPAGDQSMYLSAQQLRALAGIGITERTRVLTAVVIAYEEAEEAQEAAEETAEAEQVEADEPVAQGQEGRPESGG